MTYYPQNERGLGEVFTRMGVEIGYDSLFNVLKEFYPEPETTSSSTTNRRGYQHHRCGDTGKCGCRITPGEPPLGLAAVLLDDEWCRIRSKTR